MTEKKYRVETIVLPLIDNSIYTGLAHVLSGKVEALDTLPVPKGNIFSLNVRFNKETMLKDCLGMDIPANGEEEALDWFSGLLVLGQVAEDLEPNPTTSGATRLKLPWLKPTRRRTGTARHASAGHHERPGQPGGPARLRPGCAVRPEPGDIPGPDRGHFNGNGANTSGIATNLGVMAIALPVAACTAPGYISISVKDEKIVDDFLAELDKGVPALTSEFRGDIGIPIKGDYYKLTLKGGVTARSFAVRVGPAKFRVHCARIGKGLYITNHASVLDDIQEAERFAATRALRFMWAVKNTARTSAQGARDGADATATGARHCWASA